MGEDQKTWIVWNKERKSIVSYGTFAECEAYAYEYNEQYQTDAFEVQDYIPVRGP